MRLGGHQILKLGQEAHAFLFVRVGARDDGHSFHRAGVDRQVGARPQGYRPDRPDRFPYSAQAFPPQYIAAEPSIT